MTYRITLAACLTLTLGACRGSPEQAQAPDPTGPTSSSKRNLAALQPLAGCGELLDTVRARALAEMEEQLEQNLQRALDDQGCWAYAEDATAGIPPSPAPAQGAGGAREYSTTNNQVAGVDEADFLKNDAEHLYVLADGQLQIVDAWPAEQTHLVSKTAIEGEPKRLFVHEHRAVVYSSLGGNGSGPYRYGGGDCTYGYDCDFRGDGQPLKMTVLDLADLSQPKVLREVYFTGSFLGARRIGGAVHTVVLFPEPSISGLEYWPQGLQSCGNTLPDDAIRLLFEELRRKNRTLILETDVSDWLPSIRDVRHAGGQQVEQTDLLISCTGFYSSNQADGRAFISTVSFDLPADGSLGATTVVGRPGAIYANASSLYLASRHQQWDDGGWFFAPEERIEDATTIHKFALGNAPAESTYSGSGVVKGRVLNQFALDEHDGFLRIATTTGHLPSPDVHSTVTVLEDVGGELREAGRIDHLAPTEDIRSARFDGDRGFIVTFKKTDPLFVLDLANPFQPKVAGELKIPGFSTYMHLMDRSHLLSIGYDAADHGSFAYFQGIQLQIFDISNPASPTLKHKETIGSRGSTSEAATNHLGFNYFAPKNLLAIPMTVCEGGGDGSYGTQMTFSGLMVYDVTAAAGFSYRGGVEHLPAETQASSQTRCSNWWTQSSSIVKRSVFMDDYVFSIAPEVIKVASLNQLGSPLVSVPLK